MLGGFNYWVETILNPEAPASSSPNEEIIKYNLRKGAGMALGGAADDAQPSATASAPTPPIQKRPKKKKVQGGC